MTVEDNRILRKAATLDSMSINHWSLRFLLAAAKRRVSKGRDDGPTAERMRKASIPNLESE